MKKIVAFMAIGIVLLGGLGGAAADDEPKKNTTTEIVEVNGGFKYISVKLENTGDGCLEKVKFSICVKGGLFGKVDMNDKTTLDNLNIDNAETLTTQFNDPVFGFGRVKITVYATCAEPWTGTGLVFGSYITAIQPAS